MRKFRKIGARTLSVMAIVAAAAALSLHDTPGKAFELSNTPAGLDGDSMENAQAGSVATLEALQAIFAELQLRETTRGHTDSSDYFDSAISSLTDAQSRFQTLQWVDDRNIDLSSGRPDMSYFEQRISQFLLENELPATMSSLFVFYTELVVELKWNLEDILSSNSSSILNEPVLPRIRDQLLDLIFFGDMISQIGRSTYR